MPEGIVAGIFVLGILLGFLLAYYFARRVYERDRQAVLTNQTFRQYNEQQFLITSLRSDYDKQVAQLTVKPHI